MKALRYMILSVVLVALLATTGYAWTTDESASYGSSSSIANYSFQPVDWDGYYNGHHHRYHHRHYRTYQVYPYYSYNRYPYYNYYGDPYYSPYYYGPGVSFGFTF